MFEIKKFTTGILFDAGTSMYPSLMYGFGRERLDFDNPSSTYFGFVIDGSVKITRPDLPCNDMVKGMYFCIPGRFSVEGDGRAVIIERIGYRGLFAVGGPIEESGRLCYIDNCSTSQLVPPVRLGDPTLQQLVFPPHVDQSLHVHPTIRIGYVASGSGHCRLDGGKSFPIEEGSVFFIPERFTHSFQSGARPITVIAYHPDSDVGPTDFSHPMLSRTYVQKR